MEAACKAASRTAQLLTKDTPEEEVSQMMAVMASIKEQLSKVRAHHFTVCYKTDCFVFSRIYYPIL